MVRRASRARPHGDARNRCITHRFGTMNLRRLAPLALIVPAALALAACVGKPGPVGNAAVPQPAKPVALDAYLGKWYEYGRYEAPFQKGCDPCLCSDRKQVAATARAHITTAMSAKLGYRVV